MQKFRERYFFLIKFFQNKLVKLVKIMLKLVKQHIVPNDKDHCYCTKYLEYTEQRGPDMYESFKK